MDGWMDPLKTIYLSLLFFLIFLGEDGVDPPDLGEHAAIG